MSVVNPFYPTQLSHPRYRYFKDAADFEPITATHGYQDGKPSFNEYSDKPHQIWELVYQFDKNLPGHPAALAVFEAHYWAHRISRPFTFKEKDGNVVPNCYYQKKIVPSHEGHQSWAQERTITIICYDYAGTLLAEPLYLIDQAGNFLTSANGDFLTSNG